MQMPIYFFWKIEPETSLFLSLLDKAKKTEIKEIFNSNLLPTLNKEIYSTSKKLTLEQNLTTFLDVAC